MIDTEKETLNRFGRRIRELRKAKRLSLRDVERTTGIGNAYLSQLERGVRNPPSRRVVERLADLYGVARAELLVLAGREQPRPRIVIKPTFVDRAYDFVMSDESFRFGTRSLDRDIPLAVKLRVIELYERATGIHLLPTDTPAEELEDELRAQIDEPEPGHR
jgi:transcriptional regulator with XRE-family HTH domain